MNLSIRGFPLFIYLIDFMISLDKLGPFKNMSAQTLANTRNKKVTFGDIKKLPVSFIIVDNKPYLNKIGLDSLTRKCKTLYLVTTNKKHPAFKLEIDNLEIVYYKTS